MFSNSPILPFILMFVFGCLVAIGVLKFKAYRNLDTPQTVVLFFLCMTICGGVTYLITT